MQKILTRFARDTYFVILLIGIFMFVSGMAPAPEPKEEEKVAPVVEEEEEEVEAQTAPESEPIVIDISGEWWKFGNVAMKKVEDAISLKGKATNWYVGGCGTYVGKDLTEYNTLSLDLYGTGGGALKIELYEDDNRNWEIEQNPKKGYAPIYDDKFVYEQKIDWKGWRHISIPLNEFKDGNPKVGNDTWDPNQEEGSGGFLNLQLIAIAPKKTGVADLRVKDIRFEKL